MEAASPRSIYASENDDAKGAICLTYNVYHSAEGCLFEAVYPPPSARPFFKGLLSWQAKAYSSRKTKLCLGDFSTSLEMTIREERLAYIHCLPFC